MTTHLTVGPDYMSQGTIGDAIQPGGGSPPAYAGAGGTGTNHFTKATPCLVADIFGDWREEILLRHRDNTAIRIYINTDDAPTSSSP